VQPRAVIEPARLDRARIQQWPNAPIGEHGSLTAAIGQRDDYPGPPVDHWPDQVDPPPPQLSSHQPGRQVSPRGRDQPAPPAERDYPRGHVGRLTADGEARVRWRIGISRNYAGSEWPRQADHHVKMRVPEYANYPAHQSQRNVGASSGERRPMKLKLDLHDIYNRGRDIDKALQEIIDEAVRIKAPMIEIIPGKGSGQLKKHVLRFLERKDIKALYHRVEKDSKNFGRLFVHFRWK
jgi:hypothetical protein